MATAERLPEIKSPSSAVRMPMDSTVESAAERERYSSVVPVLARAWPNTSIMTAPGEYRKTSRVAQLLRRSRG